MRGARALAVHAVHRGRGHSLLHDHAEGAAGPERALEPGAERGRELFPGRDLCGRHGEQGDTGQHEGTRLHLGSLSPAERTTHSSIDAAPVPLVGAGVSGTLAALRPENHEDPRSRLRARRGGPWPAQASDLADVKARGTLRVIVMPLGRDRRVLPLPPGARPGFDRDVLDGFARLHRIKLEVVPVEGWDNLIPALLQGRGDLIAGRFTVTDTRLKQIAFTSEVFPSRNVVLTRKPHAPVDHRRGLRQEKVGTIKGSSMAEAVRGGRARRRTSTTPSRRGPARGAGGGQGLRGRARGRERDRRPAAGCPRWSWARSWARRGASPTACGSRMPRCCRPSTNTSTTCDDRDLEPPRRRVLRRRPPPRSCARRARTEPPSASRSPASRRSASDSSAPSSARARHSKRLRTCWPRRSLRTGVSTSAATSVRARAARASAAETAASRAGSSS